MANRQLWPQLLPGNNLFRGLLEEPRTVELNALFCCKVFRQPLRWRRCRSYVPVGAGRLHGSPGLVSPCRFARFGAEYVAAALDANHRRMAVVADAEVDDDLVRDMTELMTSLCARLYGRRSAKNRAEKALLCAAHNVGPMALSRPDGTMSS